MLTRNRATLATLAVILATTPLQADMALGAGAVLLEASFGLGLAPAVFLIEGVVAFRIFRGVGAGTPLLAVIIANLTSSILGFVFAQVALFEMSFPPARRRQNDADMFTLMALCIPFFFLSVVVEYAVARRMIALKHDSRVWRWAIEANAISYIMIVAVLLVALWSIRSARAQGLI